MRIRVTKLEERKDAHHPGNIPEGYIKEGLFVDYPQVGKGFFMITDRGGWVTSIVQEIISFNMFKTMNSVYKIEPIEEEQK